MSMPATATTDVTFQIDGYDMVDTGATGCYAGTDIVPMLRNVRLPNESERAPN